MSDEHMRDHEGMLEHGRMMSMISWFHGSWRFACGPLLDASACMMRSEKFGFVILCSEFCFNRHVLEF